VSEQAAVAGIGDPGRAWIAHD